MAKSYTADGEGNNISSTDKALWVLPLGDAVGVDYDEGAVTYPDAVTVVYTFSKDNVVVRTITLTYTDSSKQNLDSWSKA